MEQSGCEEKVTVMKLIRVPRLTGGFATVKVPAYLLRATETMKLIESGRIGGSPHLSEKDLLVLDSLRWKQNCKHVRLSGNRPDHL